MYNAEHYIERCAVSLFEQTYNDLQFIFIDDCSDDRTVSVLENVLKRYPDRCDQTIIKKLDANHGVSYARQCGLDLATGGYVTQIDADDYISTEYVSVMVASAVKFNYDVTICDFEYLFESRRCRVDVLYSHDPLECQAFIMTGEMHAGFMNKLIRKNLFDDNGLRMVPGLNMFEDKVMLLKLFGVAKSVGHVAKAMYFYDKTNASSATAQSKARQIKYLLMAWEEIKNLFQAGMTSSKRLSDATEYFRIGILGTILLFAEEPIEKYDDSVARHPSISMIWNHPVIPINYKVVLSLYSFRLRSLVTLFSIIRRHIDKLR